MYMLGEGVVFQRDPRQIKPKIPVMWFHKLKVAKDKEKMFYQAEGTFLGKPGPSHLSVVTWAGNWAILSRRGDGAAGAR